MAGNNSTNYDGLHLANIAKYIKSIDTLYNHYINECAKLGIATGLEPDAKEPFSFDNAPASIRKKYTDLMWRMRQDVESVIAKGVEKEWRLSIAKNDEMIQHLCDMTKMPKGFVKKLLVRNAAALDAFQARKTNGLGLSDRVWNIVEQTKGEMEMAIEISLSTGQPATQLSRDIRHLLKEPDMMYRRFREKKQLSDGTSKWVKYWRRKVVDDNGVTHWIKEPLEKTGRGVYRSSYKNAMRLARTETNMAYHKADSDYWQNTDLVIGIKVGLSNNHTCKGVKGVFFDICDELKGIYPKNFIFTGWHPQCRCIAVPVLPKENEVEDYLKRMADGEDVEGNYGFSGVVKDMPQGFVDWIAANEDRLTAMQITGRLPFFIRDNIAEGFKFGQGYDLNSGLRWSGNMFKTDESTGLLEVIDDTTAAQQDVLAKDLAQYSPEMQANFAELEKAWGQKRGLSMSYEDANTGKENPFFYKKNGYDVNCQTCTVTHELRRRGFNVEAICNDRKRVWKIYEKNGVGSKMEGYRIGKWLKPDGTPARPYYAREWAQKKYGSSVVTEKRIDEYLNEMMRNDGRYEICVDWKRGRSAHVFLAEKKDGVIKYFDPQSGKSNVWDKGKGRGYKYDCKLSQVGVVRIDNKLVNPKLAETFIPRGELKIYADPAVLKAQRIEAAKQARLAKRTPEKERELLEFWDKKKAEGDKRRWRERLLAKAEERHNKRTPEYIAEVMDKRNAELVRYKEAQEYIDRVKARYANNDWFKGDTTNVTDHVVYDVLDGKKVKRQWKVKHHLLDAERESMYIEAQLNTIDRMRPIYNSMSSYKSSFGSYQANLDKAKAFVIAGDDEAAQAIFDGLKGFDAAEKRYIDIKAYADAHPHKPGKPLTKIESAVKEAERLMNEGNVLDAEKFIAEAEKTRAINEASNAAKKAQREAKKVGNSSVVEPKKKTMLDAKSADDIREIYGDDAPKFLEYYENAALREDWTSPDYIKRRAEYEPKIKAFFDSVDFGHWEHSDLFGSIMENGICNIHQCNTKGKHYELGRYGYENWVLTGRYASQSSHRKLEKGWKKSDYYRCGIPMPKDMQEGWDKIGTCCYGDAHVRFRKDKVITTWTKENSLGGNCMMSLTCDPKVTSLDRKWFGGKFGSIDEFQGDWSNYVEIQYYTPKNQKLSFEHMESVIFPKNPETIQFKKMNRPWTEKEDSTRWYREFTYGDAKYNKMVLDTMTAKGVDIYYVDTKGKVQLYRKGRPLITEAEAKLQIDEMSDVKDWLKDKVKFSTKDFDVDILEQKLKRGEYIDALADIEKARELEKRANALKDLIPDVEDWNKKFTISELEAAHKAIQDKITWMETQFPNRMDGDEVIGKWLKEMEYARDPSLNPRSRVSTPYPTWEIAYKAYNRKRNEAIYKFRKASIDDNISRLRAFKTKDKDFLFKIKKLEGKIDLEEWADVEELIAELKDDMLDLQSNNIERVLNIGESRRVKFSKEDFTQAKKDAAKWFSNPDIDKAFKEADDYMSKYAQDMWKNLTAEEKHILWLYSDGSQYINQEMLGTYCLRMKSAIDGTIRNGLADANVLTSILDKAPALKESMWMQSGKTTESIRAMFGIDLSRTSDLTSIIGKEGKSNLFMSCHSAKNGAFTVGTHTGTPNDVVLSIFMPKGTKGAYMEPFASYGDNIRWKDGFDWTGTKRKTAPSNQVEFLLQRGAKFRITNAYQKGGKWYIDVDLVEQSACEALKTDIPMFNYRREREIKNPKRR